MQTIWKFPFPAAAAVEPGNAFAVEMPKGAVVRHFALHFGQPTIWAEVDSEAPTEGRIFVAVGTGKPLHRGAAYIGTFPKGHLVVHVYEPATDSMAWTNWPGGDGPPDDTRGKVVDITGVDSGDPPTSGCDAVIWTGPAAAADWSDPCRYRISAEQPDPA